MNAWQRFFAKLGGEESSPLVGHLPVQRDHVTARELAYALLHLARGSEEEDAIILKHFEGGIDLDNVRVEVFCLRAFAVDFAVWATLKDEAERTAVLDAFYGALEDIAKQDSAALIDRVKIHMLTYTEAIKEPSSSTMLWPVGKAFAKFCGSGAVEHMTSGSIVFGTSLNEIIGLVEGV